MADLSDVIEVREVGQTLANLLLNRGFRLIAVDTKTQMQKGPNASWFVRRDQRYVFGRRDGQPSLLDAIRELTKEANRLRREAEAIIGDDEPVPAGAQA